MPQKFIKVERKIEKAIKKGDIPKFYHNKQGELVKTNPYALARHATGYKGTTWHIGMKHPLHIRKKMKGGLYS